MKKKIILLSVAIALIAILIFTFFLYNNVESISLSELKFDTDCMYSNKQRYIIATLTVQGTPKESPKLYNENDEYIGEFNDEGENGDKKSNDGIYTCGFDISTAEIKSNYSKSYYAKTKKNSSNSVSLFFFAPLEEKNISDTEQTINKLYNELIEIEKPYLTEDNYIKAEYYSEVIHTFAQEVEELRKSGEISCYREAEDYVWFVTEYGVPFEFAPSVKGYLSGGNISTETKIITADRTLTIANGASDLFSENSLKKSLKNVSAENVANCHTADLSIDFLKHLPNNSVIYIFSHGSSNGYLLTNTYSTYVEMSEEYDKVSFAFNPKSTIEDEDGNIKYKVGINSKFITDNCNDLIGDYFFLSFCYSFANFADALTAKGAEFVFGFDNTVNAVYAKQLVNMIISRLYTIDNNTNNYYTVDVAIQQALDKFGSNDSKYSDTLFKKKEVYGTPLSSSDGKDMRLNETGKVSGIIYNTDNSPIKNISVNFCADSKTVTCETNNQGVFPEIHLGQKGNYNIVIKDGKDIDFSDTLKICDNSETSIEIKINEKWREAYAEFLRDVIKDNAEYSKKYKEKDKTAEQCKFLLAYLTDDDIPELVYIHTMHYIMEGYVQVYTFINDKFTECTPAYFSFDIPWEHWTKYHYIEKGNTIIFYNEADKNPITYFKFDSTNKFRINAKASYSEYDNEYYFNEYDDIDKAIEDDNYNLSYSSKAISKKTYQEYLAKYGIDDLSKFRSFNEKDFHALTEKEIQKVILLNN